MEEKKMLAAANAVVVILCLYLSLYAGLFEALYPAPVLLLTVAALVLKAGRVLPLLMVMLNICVLCMGAVVFVVALAGGLAPESALSPAWVVGFMLILLATSTFNVLRLREKAGIKKSPG